MSVAVPCSVAGVIGVDVLDRASGAPVAHIAVGNFGAINSVAIRGGVAALAIENTIDRTLPGVVVFYDMPGECSSARRCPSPVKFGAHSFSIRDTGGKIVFDSGGQLDHEAMRRGIYDDGRSDNKGVEPEGLALGLGRAADDDHGDEDDERGDD